MNCRCFQGKIFEYVDGSLSPRAQAAAKRHLERCEACRQAVEELDQTTRFLVDRLQRHAETLTISSHTRSLIISAAAPGHAPPAGVTFLRAFWARPWARLAAGVALLFACAYLLPHTGLWHFAAPRESSRAIVNDPGAAISIHISRCVPVLTFHADGNLVIDSLTCEPQVVEESLQLPGSQARRNQERNSTL